MPTILIADDNRQITSILEEYAKKEGHTPYVAFDGQEALELFYKINPDVVLLDVMMPKMDGFEVCREIRKKSDTPVIMITARGEDFEKIMSPPQRHKMPFRPTSLWHQKPLPLALSICQ